MCGIIGYVGDEEALPVLLDGLSLLEYRRYDSAGVAVASQGGVITIKSVGQVANLKNKLNTTDVRGNAGIAHTRWATHGLPSEINAHPHHDTHGRVHIVHNGIIENYRELKQMLENNGYQFRSETDTEVVAQLISYFIQKGRSFKDALFDALAMIRGAYAFALLDTENPDTLYAARLSSPLVVGVGERKHFIASDASALVGKTKDIIYLNDGEVAEITAHAVSISNLNKQAVPFDVVTLEWDLEKAQKGNFPHFMLKEIYEGPDVVRAALRGRLDVQKGIVKLGGLDDVADALKKAERIIILACGTSYYAGLVGEYIFEEIANIPTEVHIASEFRYRKEPLSKNTVAIAISQSGETADTLAAIKKAKEHGLLTLGIVNVVGSSIARETDAGVYNHAGPEIGVASTKAFLSQLSILYLMAFYFAKHTVTEQKEIALQLARIPEHIETILQSAAAIEKTAKEYEPFNDFFFLGRRYLYPVALEGALKLKEISYIHAEGYGAGEMKHGPIAMVSPDFPTIALMPNNSIAEKMYSNVQEIRARKGPVIAVLTEGDTVGEDSADSIWRIPKTLEPLEPLLAIVPLQLFAYYVGVLRGNNVDKPRNLAKSVTVE